MSSLVSSPLEPLGALVSGVSFANPWDSTLSEEIRQLLRRHALLLFRGHQGTRPEQLLGFASIFCDPESLRDPSRCPQFDVSDGGFPDFPMLRSLGTESGSVLCQLGYDWHRDGSHLTFLFCEQAPETGGETLFVSGHHLYASLPDDRKRLVNSLRVSYSNRYTSGGTAAADYEHGLRMSSTGTSIKRPAVTRQPDWHMSESPAWPLLFGGQEPKLLISPKNLDHIEMQALDGSGKILNHDESAKLADDLLMFGLQPSKIAAVDDNLLPVERTAFGPRVLEHSWLPGDLIVWDNFAVLHSATPASLYQGQSRHMIQLMFSGELLTTTPWKS